MTEQMTIRAVAGYCHTKALWTLLVDLSAEWLGDTPKTWQLIMPDMVLVDGENFRIDANEQQQPTIEFYPPEGIGNLGEAGVIWSIGAIICFASSGHYLFGGRGGAYQHRHPQIELPTLRKEHADLDAVVKRCLCYSPSQRISMRELHGLAIKGLETNRQKSRLQRQESFGDMNVMPMDADDAWPEKMI